MFLGSKFITMMFVDQTWSIKFDEMLSVSGKMFVDFVIASSKMG